MRLTQADVDRYEAKLAARKFPNLTVSSVQTGDNFVVLCAGGATTVVVKSKASCTRVALSTYTCALEPAPVAGVAPAGCGVVALLAASGNLLAASVTYCPA
jgi:hypothetical protein